MRKQTFATLQAGRGLAALAVVFYHAASYTGADPRFWKRWAYYLWFDWGELGVEYFFVLSGIVILLAHWRDLGVPSALPSYLWKRFRRVYPIYWLILLIVIPPFFVNSHLGHGFERDPWVILSSILLVHIRSQESTLHVGWTLFHEILFYFVFALSLLSRRIGMIVLGLWMLGSIAELLGWIDLDWKSGFLSPLHLLFGLGMCVTWVLKKYPVTNWLIPLSSGCAILAFVIIWRPLHGQITLPWWLPAGVAFSLITLGLMELERRNRLQIWAPLNSIGAASYSIYLVHYPLLSVTYRLSYTLDRHLHLPLWFWMLPNVSFAVAFGVLVYVVVERPLLARLSR